MPPFLPNPVAPIPAADSHPLPVGPSGVRGTVPLRIVLAKVGLDGHDRGIKVIARGLRDAGFHVIYAGIWQSPAAVSQAVVDEDADWLGISLLNGAHCKQMTQVVAELRTRGRGDVGIVLGGIIPPDDLPVMRELGVAECYGPGSHVEKIAMRLSTPAYDRPPIDFDNLPCPVTDRVLQSRILSHISADDHASSSARPGAPREGPAPAGRVIGITGSPGVGKSSFISRLIPELRSRGQTVAVLSCDPQSPMTGGALLGDRVRMSNGQADSGVFIRSLACPSGSQGVAPQLDRMIQAVLEFGYQWVLVETVGAGQGDVRIRSLVTTVVALIQPETGDALQWEKAGLLEIADLLVIAKADLPGSDRLRAELVESGHDLSSSDRGPPRPILMSQPGDQAGMVEFLQHVEELCVTSDGC